MNCLRLCYGTAIVREPTRHGNLLDLVLTNNTDIVDSVQVVEELEGSDHALYGITIPLRQATAKNI